VNSFHSRFDVLGRDQAHRYVDSANHQNILFRFDLARDIDRQFSVAGINLARLQRTSECTRHSTSGGANDIVDGRGMGLFQLCRVNLVVFRNSSVNAKNYRLGFARQMGYAEWSLLSFEAGFGNINDITHVFVLSHFQNRCQDYSTCHLCDFIRRINLDQRE